MVVMWVCENRTKAYQVCDVLKREESVGELGAYKIQVGWAREQGEVARVMGRSQEM